MVFNKLFKKDKSQEYFLQIDTAETSTPTEEKSVGQEEQVTTPPSETPTETTSTPQASAPATPPAVSEVKYEVPEWVKAIKNYSQPTSNDPSSSIDNNFAGKYVTNDVPYSRRRPGGSLSKFKEMASKMGK